MCVKKFPTRCASAAFVPSNAKSGTILSPLMAQARSMEVFATRATLATSVPLGRGRSRDLFFQITELASPSTPFCSLNVLGEVACNLKHQRALAAVSRCCQGLLPSRFEMDRRQQQRLQGRTLATNPTCGVSCFVLRRQQRDMCIRVAFAAARCNPLLSAALKGTAPCHDTGQIPRQSRARVTNRPERCQNG